jgi:hypothetical protein
MGELKLPVLIQWGELDRWIPLSDAHGFQRGIAGAELRVYPGAGHVPMEELPTPFSDRPPGTAVGPKRRITTKQCYGRCMSTADLSLLVTLDVLLASGERGSSATE